MANEVSTQDRIKEAVYGLDIDLFYGSYLTEGHEPTEAEHAHARGFRDGLAHALTFFDQP